MDGFRDNSTNIYWRLTRHSPCFRPFLRYRPTTVAHPGAVSMADARPSDVLTWLGTVELWSTSAPPPMSYLTCALHSLTEEGFDKKFPLKVPLPQASGQVICPGVSSPPPQGRASTQGVSLDCPPSRDSEQGGYSNSGVEGPTPEDCCVLQPGLDPDGPSCGLSERGLHLGLTGPRPYRTRFSLSSGQTMGRSSRAAASEMRLAPAASRATSWAVASCSRGTTSRTEEVRASLGLRLCSSGPPVALTYLLGPQASRRTGMGVEGV